MLTHYFFAFVLAACIFWLLIYPGRFDRRWTAGISITVVILLLPWYIHVPESMMRWRVTKGWLSGFSGWIPEMKSSLHSTWTFLSGNGDWGRTRSAKYLTGAIFALVMFLLVKSPHSPASLRRRHLLYIWLAAASLGPIAFDGITGNHAASIIRYVLAGMPSAFLLIAVAIMSLRPSYRLLVVGLILVGWAPNIVGILQNTARPGESYREIGAFVSRTAHPDDLVLIHSIPSGVLGISRYVDKDTQIASWVEQLGTRTVPQGLQTLIAGHRRVILVKIHGIDAPAPELDWLLKNTQQLGDIQKEDSRVLLFQLAYRRFVPDARAPERFSQPSVK